MPKYINAEKLKEILKREKFLNDDKYIDEELPGGYEHKTIRECIDEMPSADVRENKHGEWKPERTRFGFYCNKCKMYSYWATNFCPNCGADMRERKETE